MQETSKTMASEASLHVHLKACFYIPASIMSYNGYIYNGCTIASGESL